MRTAAGLGGRQPAAGGERYGAAIGCGPRRAGTGSHATALPGTGAHRGSDVPSQAQRSSRAPKTVEVGTE